MTDTPRNLDQLIEELIAKLNRLPTAPGEFQLEHTLGVTEGVPAWLCHVEIDWPQGEFSVWGLTHRGTIAAAIRQVDELPGRA